MPLLNARWLPWRYVSGGLIIGSDHLAVAYLSNRMFEGIANVVDGNVMAASVEMYQALDHLAAAIVESGVPLTDAVARALDEAGVALAKARGE